MAAGIMDLPYLALKALRRPCPLFLGKVSGVCRLLPAGLFQQPPGFLLNSALRSSPPAGPRSQHYKAQTRVGHSALYKLLRGLLREKIWLY